MLDAIITDHDLFGIMRSSCHENDICIHVCDKLLDDSGNVKDELIKILKIDAYYSSKRMMKETPKSIDCLIVVKTGEKQFGLTLVELKNVSNSRELRPSKIRPKFDTTINDFLTKKFSHIFLSEQYKISHFHLWLVTNPYRWPPNLSEDEYRKKVKNTVLEMYLSEKPYKFKNHIALIEHKPPDTEVCI